MTWVGKLGLRRAGRSAVALLAVWLLCGGLGAAAQAPTQVQNQVLSFDKAWQADDNGSGGFPTPAVKVEVALPDDWARSRPQEASPAWYQLQISPEQYLAWPTDMPLALFIGRACGKLTVQLNGAAVLAGGPLAAGAPTRCGHPVLVHLPAPLWTTAQANLIDVRVEGQPLARVASRERAASLAAVSVGPAAQLQRGFELAHSNQVVLPQFTTIALMLVGLLVIMLGWWHRGETHLVYFGLMALLWGLISARLWWPFGGLPSYDTELLITALVPLTAFATVQFLLFYAGWRSRPVEAALLVQCVIVPAIMLASGPNRVHATASFWYLVMAIEVVAAGAFFLRTAYRSRRREFAPMAAGMTCVSVLLVFEYATQQGFISSNWRTVPQLMWPLLAIAMGLWLMYQHGRALHTAEDVQRALEVRLRETTEAMERNYNQMAELRVEKVTQQERKRIAADLHDDLGAKLLTIVHTSDNDRISSLAREALEEMRLSVRGLTGKPVKLIDALGDWRAEVVSRLSQTGVEGDWQAPTDDLPQTLSARTYVQTTRILREAVNNIIKHSGASRCTIKCLLADGDFQLVIQDNGKGIPMEMDGKLDRGHGMSSMKHRAKQMQGQCLVESGPGYGTLIRLTLPLDKQLMPEASPR
jgi:two-component system, NarL family, sensor histidine kinase UhpB